MEDDAKLGWTLQWSLADIIVDKAENCAGNSYTCGTINLVSLSKRTGQREIGRHWITFFMRSMLHIKESPFLLRLRDPGNAVRGCSTSNNDTLSIATSILRISAGLVPL
jgi:hypothetical protein